MATVSSEMLILFIASILVAASVAGTMTTGVNQLSNALSDRSLDVSYEIRTDVEIISDPGSGAVYDNGTNTVTILVKNTGSGMLSADATNVDVLIDGDYHTNITITVVDGDSWATGNVARVEANSVDLGSGDHRIMVVVNGDEERMEFRT